MFCYEPWIRSCYKTFSCLCIQVTTDNVDLKNDFASKVNRNLEGIFDFIRESQSIFKKNRPKYAFSFKNDAEKKG